MPATPPSNRRNFILSSAATTLAAGALTNSATSQVAASPIQPATASKVRVGIIGSTGRGNYGHGVDVAFTKLPQVEIVALADDNPKGLEEASQRTHPQKTYADYRQMLAQEELDVVAICPRWIDQHHDMIVAAAKAGCHIYMEKPFCRTLLECDSAIKELDARRLKLGIAHVSQYSPVLEVVKNLIEQDEIGEILELRGRGKEDHRGGGEDLWVLGSHVLGLMRKVAGSDATSCTAIMQAQGHPVTKADVIAGAEGLGPLAGDHVQATYAFEHGVFGYFASKKAAGGSPSRFGIQILGSKGIIEMTTGYLEPAYLLRDTAWSPGRTGASWTQVTSAGIGRPEPRNDGNYEGGHMAAINDLLESIQQDRPTLCSAHDCRQITEMISAVFESHRVGQTVTLPLATRVHPLTLL
ncbi:MAG: Gfo/Idh/MocA family oxidoreductase [Pirellulaceae bacterium]